MVGHAREYVTCDFLGQLGNQMWQVSAVIGYALDHDCEPIFPLIRQADRGALNYRYVFHRLNTLFPLEEVKFVDFEERHPCKYGEIPYQKGRSLRLRGYFASPKYFEKQGAIIRELLAPTQEILDQIQGKYGSLLQEPTVAVHVRTFIPDCQNPDEGIGGATWGYFTTAMDYFPQNVHFLVFSDAMEWTKTHFPKEGRRVTFIEGNPHYLDFYFMSLCDHVIVSPESTFSWWAAWLNRNPDKIVILADTWAGLLDNDTIPADWLKLPKQPPFFFTRQPKTENL